ncbi:hypothetical protein [Microvirga pakistanensis]|uniref:hypothetical protein n=1 Tax=Microvirga pakistanensis TaxID=1682650 RepID=UPI00141AA1BA|nr:hypothetical protein [Microvirga pakistanensis]
MVLILDTPFDGFVPGTADDAPISRGGGSRTLRGLGGNHAMHWECGSDLLHGGVATTA